MAGIVGLFARKKREKRRIRDLEQTVRKFESSLLPEKDMPVKVKVSQSMVKSLLLLLIRLVTNN